MAYKYSKKFYYMTKLNFRSFLITLIFLLCGCVSHHFPMYRPIPELNRYGVARERAEDYFIKARDYDRRGLHQMAEHFYELALKLDPKSQVLKELLINKYILSQKYNQAIVLIKGQNKIEQLSAEDKRSISGLYLKMEQYSKSAEILESINSIELDEYRTLGFIYERLNKNEKAIKYYSAFVQENPNDLKMAVKIADLYSKMQEYDKAESVYVALERQFDDKSQIINGLGAIKLLKKDTASAIQFFKTALLLDSTSTRAITNIAQIYISQEDYPKAIKYYEKLIEDNYVSKFYNKKTLALLYYYNRQYSEAENILTSLLTENIDDHELHFYLGLVFAENNKTDLAEIELRKALTLKENYSDAWIHLCYLILKKKNWDSALECAKTFHSKMPKIGASWRLYGYALNISKQYKEAINILKKALNFDENDPSVWFELGSAYERTGNYKKAAVAFKQVLSIHPEDAAAANYLGYMWADQNKNLDSAEILLEMALELDPDNGAYLDSYGWIYYKKGNLEKAELYILKALEKIDMDPIIFDHLGDILYKKGDNEGALKAYQKCIELGFENQKEIEEKIMKLQFNHKLKIEVPALNEVK